MFKKIIGAFAKKIEASTEQKAILLKGNVKKEEVKIFLENLKSLSKMIYPYKHPKNFKGFYEYKSMDMISFKTIGRRYLFNELVELTGLTTLRHVGRWDHDEWEASYREYLALHESSGANKARIIQIALANIQSQVRESEGDYSDFIIKYSDTLSNIIEIINQFGIKLILEDDEIFDGIRILIGTLAQDYDNYTVAIKEFKKAQVLEMLDLEQELVNTMMKNSLTLLDFNQK